LKVLRERERERNEHLHYKGGHPRVKVLISLSFFKGSKMLISPSLSIFLGVEHLHPPSLGFACRCPAGSARAGAPQALHGDRRCRRYKKDGERHRPNTQRV
jgi:hypothetical protein